MNYKFRLEGIISIGESGKLSFNLNVYSADMKKEYGMLIVKEGELVKAFGKAKEVWPCVREAFHL